MGTLGYKYILCGYMEPLGEVPSMDYGSEPGTLWPACDTLDPRCLAMLRSRVVGYGARASGA